MEPTKLRFHVEALRQKVVPIRAFLVGEPTPGYSAGDPTLVPDHALISGPASQVRNVTEVAIFYYSEYADFAHPGDTRDSLIAAGSFRMRAIAMTTARRSR